MRAKFGSDPTAGSKILSFKFISRLDGYPASLGFPIMHQVHVICIHPCHPPDKQYTEFIIYTCSLFFICNNKVAMARARCGIGCVNILYTQDTSLDVSFHCSLAPSYPRAIHPPLASSLPPPMPRPVPSSLVPIINPPSINPPFLH